MNEALILSYQIKYNCSRKFTIKKRLRIYEEFGINRLNKTID